MSSYHMQREGADRTPALEEFSDHTLFQTPEWSAYLAVTQHSEEVVATISDAAATVRRFTGQIVRQLRTRILGSPFPG